jgi:pyruvate kinase
MAELLTRRVYRKTLASIVASIKAQHDYSSLLAMVKCGVTIFRINFSWFNKAPETLWVTKLREIGKIAQEEGLVLGIMLDTKGPEFRVRNLDTDTIPLGADPNGRVYEPGKDGYIYERNTDITLTLDPNVKTTAHTISVEAPLKTRFHSVGRRVVLGDGDYEAFIKPFQSDESSMNITPSAPICVWDGAKVNFPGTLLTAKALGDEDKKIIRFFLEAGKDMDERVNFIFAQSFIKSVADVQSFIDYLQNVVGVNVPIVIAKLETYESSLPNSLERIIEAASGVMIARGDLANQTSRGDLPQLQRRIIRVAKRFNKSVLLATQVYGSMKDFRRSKCSRPEAEDVRSALELGVDGFVLTEETTARSDPETVVHALADQIEKDEEDLITQDQRDPSEANHYERLREIERLAFHKSMRKQMRDPSLHIDIQRTLGTTDFAIAAVFRANQYGAIGVFPFTVHGSTVREMCRFYPETGIFPVTTMPKIAQSLLLCRCTHPILVRMSDDEHKEFYIDRFKELVREIVNVLELRERKLNARYAICTMAHPPLQPGGTDTLLRIRIEDS